MRNSKLAVLAALAFAMPAFGQSIRSQVESPGKIVIYRGPSIWGAGLGCPVRYKGQEIVELGRGKFAEWEVPAGRYILTNKTASVEVSVDPGEVRYVRCMIKTGFLTGRSDFQIVDEESFKAIRGEFERKEIAPLNR